ncbi:MAG: biotin/lipoyl-binding protein, partial [Rhodobacteraceae bacterium]|nr:biotin/lipoyl-binding protein [Paracoccaceae bacterium]
RNFLPSTGRLVHYLPPAEGKNVRVDTGVYEGGEISVFYDPMIAKLITYGKTRDEATAEMRAALDAYYIRGVSHNIPFLASLMGKKKFIDGKLSTNFIAEEYPDGFSAADLPAKDPTVLMGVAALVHQAYQARAAGVSGQLPGRARALPDTWVVVEGDGETKTQHRVSVARHPVGGAGDLGPASGTVTVGNKTLHIASSWTFGQPLYKAEVVGSVSKGKVKAGHIVVQVDRRGIGYRLFHAGAQVDVVVLTVHEAELAKHMLYKPPPDLSQFLLSPMPGLLVSLAVKEGQDVKAGEALAIVEAMKMENVLKAERDGTVKTIHQQPGASLAVDQVILEFA